MEEEQSPVCPDCGGSRVFRDGLRYTAEGVALQRWLCRVCGKRFSEHKAVWQKHKNCTVVNNSYSQICAFEAKNLEPPQVSRACVEQKEVKTAPQIAKFLDCLANDGLTEGTVENYRKTFLRLLNVGADLYDPDSVKAALAKLPHKNSAKRNMVAQLTRWFEWNGLMWKPPRFTCVCEAPYIPTEEELDSLITALGKKTATFCQLLKDTGARSGEIAQLKWQHIDFTQRLVRITAEKGSNSRVLPLSPKAVYMLSQMKRNSENYIFPSSNVVRNNFNKQRRRIARKLGMPQLMQIHFHTFRHWKATMEQHKTKDPWHVKQILGHKTITSTEQYIHLEKAVFQSTDDQWIVKVANTLEEAVKLLEVGFEYHTEIQGYKLFRKRK